MIVEAGKTYKTRSGELITLGRDRVAINGMFATGYSELGECPCSGVNCPLDLVEEVKGVIIGPEEGVTYSEVYGQPKQSLLSLSLNLPQGTETITLTQKVLVDGVEYIANIELEKV